MKNVGNLFDKIPPQGIYGANSLVGTIKARRSRQERNFKISHEGGI